MSARTQVITNVQQILTYFLFHVCLIKQGEGEAMLAIPAAQKPRKIKLSEKLNSQASSLANCRNMFTA